MKASELVEMLQDLIKKEGDCEIVMYRYSSDFRHYDEHDDIANVNLQIDMKTNKTEKFVIV